jgi:hypothetical protein
MHQCYISKRIAFTIFIVFNLIGYITLSKDQISFETEFYKVFLMVAGRSERDIGRATKRNYLQKMSIELFGLNESKDTNRLRDSFYQTEKRLS